MHNNRDDPIKHVILLILENHSFDQMLGSLKSIFPELDGIDIGAPHYNADGRGNIVFGGTFDRQL